MSVRGSPQTRYSRPLLLVALAALLAVAIFGTGGHRTATAAVGNCSPEANWGTVRADLASQVVGLVNQHRAGLGLGGLAESARLTASAVWKARHMAFYGYFSHEDPAPPVARSTGDRMAACGYTAGWGENIAYGYASPSSVMQGWLSSAGHKANIERSSFRAIGVGVAAAADGRLYWVQTFGTVADSGSPPPPAPSPTPPNPPPPPSPTPPPAPKPPAPAPKLPAPAPKPSPAAPRAPTPAAPSAQSQPRATPAATPVPATRIVRDSRPQLEASTLLEWGPAPRAGRKFTGRLMITLPGGTHQRLFRGRATCKAWAGGRPVWVGINRFRNGFVVCKWRLPPTSAGARFTGTIRVFAAGGRTSRWFSRVVG